MREGYITDITTSQGNKPVCDEESLTLATQANERAAVLEGKVSALEAAHAYMNSSDTWFGCRWPKGNSNTEGTPVGNLFRLKYMQDILKIGGYMVKNDHSRRKLNRNDHRIYENGEAVDFTGADGHYQWGWGVGLYYAAWEDEDYEYEAFDDRPIPGVPCVYIPVGSRSCAGFAQLDRTNNILCSTLNKTAQFRGGNNTSAWDETYRSLLGKPATNITVANFATYARANGTMWFTSERVMIFITGALIRVFFHNRNIGAAFNATLTADGLHQGGLGQGESAHTVSEEWNAFNSRNPFIDLDCGIERGDFTGLLSTTIKDAEDNDVNITGIPCFMGLKNFYKYLTTMTEDEVLVNQDDKSQALYIEKMIDGSSFDMSGAGTHTLVGKTPIPAAAGWSYIKKISMDYLSGMPVESGGTEDTFYADGYYNPKGTSGDVRGCVRLGSASSGVNAGSCYLSGNNAPSNAFAFRGAVLCEFTLPFTTELAVIA